MVNLYPLINNEYLRAAVIFLSALLFSKIFLYVIKNYLKKITRHTKTEVDDLIINIVAAPSYFLIIFLGLYTAIKTLSLSERYAVWIDSISYVVIALLITFLISRILTVLISHWLKVQKRFEKTPQLISKIATVILYIIAVLIVLSHFKVEITPMITALGVGGLAVGLALQNTLSNLFAGLHIISDRPVNVGDFIEVNGASGFVEDIGWRSTRLKTRQNNMIIIPNSKLAESTILNYYLQEQELSVSVECGVAYGSNLEKVEKATFDVAKKIQKSVAGAVKDFEPTIRFHTLAESNINFTVSLRAKTFDDKYLLVHEFIKALKERYDKEKIEISWPVRKIVK